MCILFLYIVYVFYFFILSIGRPVMAAAVIFLFIFFELLVWATPITSEVLTTSSDLQIIKIRYYNSLLTSPKLFSELVPLGKQYLANLTLSHDNCSWSDIDYTSQEPASEI
jgi:hypothetical protein